MITRLLLLLLVYKTTRCNEVAATKTSLFVPVISEKCKNIKCSTQEDPRCVKIKNERHGNAIFIIVLNKCEIQYMECVNGFDAKVVSMKYCGHHNLTMTATSNSTENNSGKRRSQKRSIAHSRVKRGARKQRAVISNRNWLKNKKLKMKQKVESSYEGEPGYEVRLEEDDSYYDSDYPVYRVQKLMGPALTRPLNALQKAKGNADGPVVLVGPKPHGKLKKDLGKSDDPVNLVGPKQHSKHKMDFGILENPMEEEERKMVERWYKDQITKNKNVYGKIEPLEGDLKYSYNPEPNKKTIDEYGEIPQPEEKLKYYPDYKKINKDLFPLFSKETIDELGKNQNTDSADGNIEQCPSSCPARVQMVCGKCQHGIYKTFMSSCHMRMFSCKYSAESMELVSRYPCILSAPYIAQAGVLERSKVVDGTEGDQVLSFIKCRSLGLLRTNDPRCPF